MTPSSSVDRALLTGIAWTAVLRWASEAISWAATLFVARILVPGDYGLVAMAAIPIGLVRMVEDFGLDSILVQDRSIVGARQAQLCGFVLGIGVTLTVLGQLITHPVSRFFNEPQLSGLISILSALFISDALQVGPRATLQRKFAFFRLALLLPVQVAATQTILIAAALAGWGAWSLAISNVSGNLLVTALLWYWQPQPIQWPADIKSLATPLLQGWRVMASRFAYYAYSTSDQTIIGRFLGKDALGAYSFSLTFANIPFQGVSSVITRVVPGIFSEVQGRKDELRRYFLMLTECLAFITFPMSVGLALTADLMVRVVLGPNWNSVIAPLQIMCLYSAFQGLQILISPLLMWTGQFRAQMWCSILTGITLPIGFFIAAPHGLVAIALVWAVVYPVTNLPAVVIGLQTVRVSLWRWLDTALPAAVACAAMAGAVVAVRSTLGTQGELTRLGLAVAVGAATYCVAVWVLFRARVVTLFAVVKEVRAHSKGGASAPTLA